MFDQINDSFRKAAETSFQMQQEMFKQLMTGWPSQFPGMPGMPGSLNSATSAIQDQVHSFQKNWADTLTTTMNKHREAMDAQYKNGIQAIEAAFHTAEARSPEEYRRLTEDFWRKSFESLKSAFEIQAKEFQALSEKWVDLATKVKV